MLLAFLQTKGSRFQSGSLGTHLMQEWAVGYLFCADLLRNSARSPICGRRSAQSGPSAVDMLHIFSRLAALTHTLTHHKLFLPPDCGNLHRRVYYTFEKELKTGPVILGHLEKKDPNQPKDAGEEPPWPFHCSRERALAYRSMLKFLKYLRQEIPHSQMSFKETQPSACT